jgi:dUTP pyrophosphatase
MLTPPSPDALPVALHRLPHAADLALPAYETERSAGLDLRAAVPADAPVTLDPGERALLPTGLQIALPKGTHGEVRPRSGLASRHGVTVLNGPGTIDADYRGEVKVLLINHGANAFVVERGARIAQLVVSRHERIAWEERDALPETVRGAGGFGSTGTQ